jgi:PTH1 family peptidyl-tRNA hydrolase
MALFVKKPELGSRLSFTTYGMNKALLIVGLGNVGEEYDGTRHNIGFACVDEFARKNDFPAWVNKTDLKCLLTSTLIGDTKVYLCKPTTFMNLSGEAVQAISHFYKLPLEQIIVVHDELDIDFGQVRLRRGGSSAGHNGIKSVSKHIGEEYGRVRIGVGPKHPEQIDSADFVLGKFAKKDAEHLPQLKREVNAILSELAYGSPLTPETRTFL